MELWVVLVVLTQFAWVSEIFIDKFLVHTPSEGGDGSSVGALVLVSAFFNIVVAGIIFGVLATLYGIDGAVAKITFDALSLRNAIAVGVLEILWLIPYFHALRSGDETSAPPVFQTVPIFGFMLGLFVFGEIPTLVQVGAGIVILLGSVLLNLELLKQEAREKARKAFESFKERVGKQGVARLHGDKAFERLKEAAEGPGKISLNTRTLGLMLLASFIIAVSGFVFKDAALEENFWGTAFWMTIGAFGSGLCLWAFVPKYRKQFHSVMEKKQMLRLNILNEVIDNVAMLAYYGAIVVGPSVAIIQLTNAYQPILLLVASFILARWGSERHTEMFASRDGKVTRKVIGITAIVVGSLIIFT